MKMIVLLVITVLYSMMSVDSRSDCKKTNKNNKYVVVYQMGVTGQRLNIKRCGCKNIVNYHVHRIQTTGKEFRIYMCPDCAQEKCYSENVVSSEFSHGV